ncbi:MAG: hypothetical protein LBQ65_10545 [Tannerellaceae bacterium]|jgi:hypothetical protein|nr:hypothetical protein [Tannerellaceae bacterium]
MKHVERIKDPEVIAALKEIALREAEALGKADSKIPKRSCWMSGQEMLKELALRDHPDREVREAAVKRINKGNTHTNNGKPDHADHLDHSDQTDKPAEYFSVE